MPVSRDIIGPHPIVGLNARLLQGPETDSAVSATQHLHTVFGKLVVSGLRAGFRSVMAPLLPLPGQLWE